MHSFNINSNQHSAGLPNICQLSFSKVFLLYRGISRSLFLIKIFPPGMFAPVPEYILFADVHIKSNAMCSPETKGRQNTPGQILNI